jgi:polysaccharide biosynthesis transport protein
MKEEFSDSSSNRLIQPQDSFEPRQSEGMSLGFILTSLSRYWYVSILLGSLIMAGIVYKTSKEPRLYKSGIQLAIELKNSYTVAEKIAGANSVVSDDRNTKIETITQILKSKTIVQKAINSIPNQELRPSVDRVLSNMTVSSAPNTDILYVNYNDTSPSRIVEVLNALSKVYIDYNIETRKASTNSSISFIESQLPESRKRLETSARGLEEFRQKYRFFDPESSAKKSTDYRQDLIKQLNEVRVQSKQTQKQSEELNKQLGEVGLKSDSILSKTMLTQDSVYQELFRKLNELELAYSQERVKFQDGNPLVVSAKEKRDAVLVLLKQRAQQVLNRAVMNDELTNGGIANFSNSLAQNLAGKQAEIETAAASQAAQYKSLSEIYQQIEAEIAQLPTLQKQYTELQRQYTIYSQELTSFLQKLQELKVASAEQTVPWKLLDPPELPTQPISPDVPKQLGTGALISLLAGILAAIGLNKLDNRIDNPDAIRAIMGMPVLALIPRAGLRSGTFLQVKTKDVRRNYSYWSFVEAIRTLALEIGLTNNRKEDQLGRVIALTSAMPGEGKSTVAFHTSIVLAELGYRTLLVDVDLSRATISQMCRDSALFESMDCFNTVGLTDVFVRGDDWRSLIKKSDKSNLEVLFSGQHPVNSISLLNSPRFRWLIAEWKKEYDYVIFDSPPVVGVSDTRLIGTLVDGLVFVVGLNLANRRLLARAVDTISAIGTPVLGLAINRVENRYSSYNKYYKYYQGSTRNSSNSRSKGNSSIATFAPTDDDN